MLTPQDYQKITDHRGPAPTIKTGSEVDILILNLYSALLKNPYFPRHNLPFGSIPDRDRGQISDLAERYQLPTPIHYAMIALHDNNGINVSHIGPNGVLAGPSIPKKDFTFIKKEMAHQASIYLANQTSQITFPEMGYQNDRIILGSPFTEIVCSKLVLAAPELDKLVIGAFKDLGCIIHVHGLSSQNSH